MALERHGVTPASGPILVTGAAGGVGSIATAILSKRGFQVTASTGRRSETDYLKSLGASEVIERSELTDAVRRVSQLADQRSHAVKLAVSKEGIEISASSPEYGEAKENIDKEYKGDPIAIGFNSTYMLDFLSAAADGPVSIELKDEQSAGQMRPLADESYRYRYIIMPMRI